MTNPTDTVLVLREPTEAMLLAGQQAAQSAGAHYIPWPEETKAVWSAMLAAAPSLSQPEVERLRAENERLTDALAKAGEFQERFRAENERLTVLLREFMSDCTNHDEEQADCNAIFVGPVSRARAFLSSLSTETGNG